MWRVDRRSSVDAEVGSDRLAWCGLSMRSVRVAGRQEILCQMLEWGLISDGQEQRVTVSTLLSSEAGAQRYRQLCERMNQLRELVSARPSVQPTPSASPAQFSRVCIAP